MYGGEVGNVGVEIADEHGRKRRQVFEFVECVGEKCVGAGGSGGALVAVGPSVDVDYVESTGGVEGAHGNFDSSGGGGFPVRLGVDLWFNCIAGMFDIGEDAGGMAVGLGTAGGGVAGPAVTCELGFDVFSFLCVEASFLAASGVELPLKAVIEVFAQTGAVLAFNTYAPCDLSWVQGVVASRV